MELDRAGVYPAMLSRGRMDHHGTSWTDRALALLALVSYLWLCLAWFDHEIPVPPFARAPAAPASLLLLSLSLLLFRRRARLSIPKDGRIAVLLALAAFVSRLPYALNAYGLFSSDAAAQGVMALHVLEGRHHPIFLYNWSYVGSPKAHLTALLARIASDPVVAFALAAVLVYAALTASVYLLARTVLPRPESVAASLYIVFAPGFLTAWGMGNEGSYPDVLVLGTAMLVLAARFLKDEMGGAPAAFWMGLLGGLAFWIHILATYYLIAAAGVLLVHRFGRKTPARMALFAFGFAVGDFPGILWNASHDFLSFRWWSLDAASAPDSSRLERAFSQLGEVFTTSFAILAGYWPRENPPSPETPFWLLLLLLFPACFLFYAWRHRDKLLALGRGRLTPEATFLGFAVLVVLVFAQSSFGWMTDEPRYLLFLFSVIPIFLASALSELARRFWPGALFVSAVLVFVSLRGAVLYYAAARDSDVVNRDFIARLSELGLRHVHSDYHLSYKYVFLSHGRMVWSSALGPSETEWYVPFREEVAQANDVALVPRSFRFARRIERRLTARGIRYRRENLLYPVLFDFSEPIRLEELR